MPHVVSNEDYTQDFSFLSTREGTLQVRTKPGDGKFVYAELEKGMAFAIALKNLRKYFMKKWMSINIINTRDLKWHAE